MLREQIITPRVGSRDVRVASGNSSPGKGGDFVQRPAARNGRTSSRTQKATKKSEWSLARVLTFVPLFLKIVLAGCILFVAVIGYRAAAAAPFFQMQTVDISGNRRTPSRDVEATVKKYAAREGVWRADIDAIKNDLERMTWVRAATVARVLPSGIRVRIAEREPHLVVRTESGRLMWADDEGMLLGAFTPNDEMPQFFVRGVEESNTGDAKRQNRERVAKYNEMRAEWDAANLTTRISEVNLDDLNDVRAQLAGTDSAIEVRLGGQDFGKRLARALRVLDQAKQTSNGERITRLDAASNQSHVIVGTSSGFERTPDALSSAATTNATAADTANDGRTPVTPTDKATRDKVAARDANRIANERNVSNTQSRRQSARRAEEQKKTARTASATTTPRARVVGENSTRGNNTRGRAERPRRAATNGEGRED